MGSTILDFPCHLSCYHFLSFFFYRRSISDHHLRFGGWLNFEFSSWDWQNYLEEAEQRHAKTHTSVLCTKVFLLRKTLFAPSLPVQS